jgi:hypothetical protein
MSGYRRFEADLRAWLEGAGKGQHPLLPYWICDQVIEHLWTIRRRLREAGFEEVWSPWRQPRRPPGEGNRVRQLLARIGPLAGAVRRAFRWRGFLVGTVTFLLLKPGPSGGAAARGAE